MTFGIVLLKGKPEKRDDTESLLHNLQKNHEFLGKFDVKIERVFKCLGWPDFVLILEAKNIERMMQAVVEVRKRALKCLGEVGYGDFLDTTTLVCTILDESRTEIEEFSKKFRVFKKENELT